MTAKKLPNGEWFYRFQFKKREYRKQGFRTRQEAEQAGATKQTEVVRRSALSHGLDDNLRLYEAADVFFEEYSRPYKRTWYCDAPKIRVIKQFFGERRIKDITPMDVDAFRRHVQRTVKGISKPLVTPHTVNHYHALLKAIINWAKKKRLYFGENPAWGVEMAKVERARVRFLNPDEEKRLTPIIARNPQLRPYYVVGLHTGMRIAEICAIRVRDVTAYPEPMVFIPHAKAKRSRYVPLHGLAADILLERVKGKAQEAAALEGLHKETVSRWFKASCQEAGVLSFTFHCLRHTFASHMLTKGVPIYKVSKVLGHSSVVVTEQHYGHLDRNMFSKDIEHIGSVMSVPSVVKVAENSPEAVNRP